MGVTAVIREFFVAAAQAAVVGAEPAIYVNLMDTTQIWTFLALKRLYLIGTILEVKPCKPAERGLSVHCRQCRAKGTGDIMMLRGNNGFF